MNGNDNGWIEGAIHDPGARADYDAGHSSMTFVVEHFTAGTDSRNIGKNGYFNGLFPKVGPMIQYAPIPAVTWNSGPFNPYGPGWEFERLNADEDLTEDQLFWGGVTAAVINRDYGVPLEHYQGPRFQVVSSGFRGFVNHSDLDDQRSDGVTQDEWLRMMRNNAPAPPFRRRAPMIFHDIDLDKWYRDGAGGLTEIAPAMAYAMAVSGCVVVDKLHTGDILALGINAARTLQRALAIKF